MVQKGWGSIKHAYLSENMLPYRVHTRNMEEFALDFLLKPWKYDYFDPDCHIGAATTFKVYTIDLQVYAALSKKQYGFKWGSSTLAATQKVVMKLEFPYSIKGWRVVRFLT